MGPRPDACLGDDEEKSRWWPLTGSGPGSTLPALVGAPSRNDATIQASRGRYVRLTQRGR
jgi:hypothetical protein